MAQRTSEIYDKELNKTIFNLKHQRTFVMIKPDGVMRGLAGDIISRIENRGLKIVSMKMLIPSENIIRRHYPTLDEKWISRLGGKAKSGLDGTGLDVKATYGTDDENEIGHVALDGLIKYMQSGPVIAMVVEGVKAIEQVRKMVGSTLPSKSAPGTIRGDYSVDDPVIANVEGRSLHNLIHASEIPEEAEAEINLWFASEEICDYDLAADEIMYCKHY